MGGNTVTGGLFWPRGSSNQYLYGSGFWFGAKKTLADGTVREVCTYSYNPITGNSIFIPGKIEDGDTLFYDKAQKYRLYVSTDFNQQTGEAISSPDGPNWPLWISDTTLKCPFGTFQSVYESDENMRNVQAHHFGPEFVSNEEMYSVFKDTYYDEYMQEWNTIGQSFYQGLYPLRLEVESRVYTFTSDDKKDVLILSYFLTNKSNDTFA